MDFLKEVGTTEVARDSLKIEVTRFRALRTSSSVMVITWFSLLCLLLPDALLGRVALPPLHSKWGLPCRASAKGPTFCQWANSQGPCTGSLLGAPRLALTGPVKGHHRLVCREGKGFYSIHTSYKHFTAFIQACSWRSTLYCQKYWVAPSKEQVWLL